MAKTAKKTSASSPEEFVLMGRTRALLGEVWNIWRDNLGHTPEVAKRMITAGIHELHNAEKPVVKAKKQLATKAKAKKTAVKKAFTKTVKKAKTAKKKLK